MFQGRQKYGLLLHACTLHHSSMVNPSITLYSCGKKDMHELLMTHTVQQLKGPTAISENGQSIINSGHIEAFLFYSSAPAGPVSEVARHISLAETVDTPYHLILD